MLATGDYRKRAEDTEMLSQMYFERWGLLLSKGDFYGVFNVLNVPTTCVLNTLLTTQQRGVHNVALSPQAEQRYTLETLKTILPVPTSDNDLRHRSKKRAFKKICLLCFSHMDTIAQRCVVCNVWRTGVLACKKQEQNILWQSCSLLP